MSKGFFALLFILLLLVPLGAAAGETVVFGGVSVPADAEYVDMGGETVTDFSGFYAFLDQLPNLKRADMFETVMKLDWCDEMAARYPEIRFGWTIRFAEHTLRTDATAFSTLHYSDSAEHDEDLRRAVSWCTELRALDIGHNGVENLDFLYNLSELRVLIVAVNKITDITPIGSLSHLEYLEIFNNKIKDISPLAGLTHLMDLNMGYNLVEDYSPLYGLTNLKRLWLYRSNGRYKAPDIPRSVVKAIKEAIPGVQIDVESEPSLGGWREHPHFDILHRMMRTTVYEPFEDSFEADAETAAP